MKPVEATPTVSGIVKALAVVDGAKASPSAGHDASPPTPDRAELVRAAIDDQIAQLGLKLPSTTERFASVMLAAFAVQPNLIECLGTPEGQRSLVLSALKASLVGLEPNTETQDCWLEPVLVKPPRKRKRWECRLLMGYRGRRKLIRNDPNVLRVFAELVREGDDFRPTPFSVEPFHHPFDKRNRDGELRFAYACVVYKDGRIEPSPTLWRQDIDRHREHSPSWQADVAEMERNPSYQPRSAWILFEEDMWRKTALIELSKVADLSSQTVLDLLADGAPLEVDAEGRIVAARFDAEEYVSRAGHDAIEGHESEGVASSGSQDSGGPVSPTASEDEGAAVPPVAAPSTSADDEEPF